MAPTVTDISDSRFGENASTKDILNTIWDELAAIRRSLGSATNGSGVGILVGSATYDAGAIADNAHVDSKDITVPGAAVGDFVIASMGVDLVDLNMTAYVSAADTVTITLSNNTGGSVNLASTTARVFVIPKSAVAIPAMVLTK